MFSSPEKKIVRKLVGKVNYFSSLKNREMHFSRKQTPSLPENERMFLFIVFFS